MIFEKDIGILHQKFAEQPLPVMSFDAETSSGSTIEDIAVNGNKIAYNRDLTVTGAATTVSVGDLPGYTKAFSFDGASIAQRSSVNLNISKTQTLTFCSFVKINGNNGQHQGILRIGTQLNTLGFIWIYRKLNSSDLTVQSTDGVNYTNNTKDSVSYFNTENIWIHVTVSIDCLTGKYKIYKNGQLISEFISLTIIPPVDNTTIAIGSYTISLNRLTGYLAATKIFDKILTNEEVQLEYQKTLTVAESYTTLQSKSSLIEIPIPVAHFDMETSTTVIEDLGKNGNGINYNNDLNISDITFVSDAPTGLTKSMLVGALGWANGGFASLKVDTSKKMTVAFWCKCNLQADTYQAFVRIGRQNEIFGHFWTSRQLNSNQLNVYYSTGSSGSGSYGAANFFTGFNNIWVHVVEVIDYAAGTITVYRNGVLFSSTSGLTMVPILASTDVSLGSYYYPSVGTPFHIVIGNIAEVKVFNVTLSNEEIQLLYNTYLKMCLSKLNFVVKNKIIEV